MATVKQEENLVFGKSIVSRYWPLIWVRKWCHVKLNPDEREVLFKRGSMFIVTKREGCSTITVVFLTILKKGR